MSITYQYLKYVRKPVLKKIMPHCTTMVSVPLWTDKKLEQCVNCKSYIITQSEGVANYVQVVKAHLLLYPTKYKHL